MNAERAARPGVVQPAIRIRGITKRFPARRTWMRSLLHPMRREFTAALANVDCEVRRGEFFGLLGPNGAGKTTLFKILATLVLPDEGSATVEGHDAVRDAAGVRRVLAPVVADERSLNWRLSATENLRLFARLQGARSAAADRRVADLLDVVGLSAEGPKLVGAFSSGMKQRLLLARALVATPKVLLLDEPTRSLDPITARDFRTFLRDEIAGRQGCSVMLATHNTDEALQLCDRVAILHRGRLVATGTRATLEERFGDARYRLLTRHPEPTMLTALSERGVISEYTVSDAEQDGWSVVELTVPGGPERIAHVVRLIVTQGIEVARCERLELSLADLIERVLQHA